MSMAKVAVTSKGRKTHAASARAYHDRNMASCITKAADLFDSV